jgi:D-alanyl-lipoteichoic acid acyltransferase DltB (MBOAT superfamily)
VLFFVLYWAISKKQNVTARNIFIVLASYLFYGWWDWRFLSLIVVSSAVDFVVGKRIYQSDSQKDRKRLLMLSVCVNLGILGFFKYYNFFVDSFADALSALGYSMEFSTLSIILPVGISFYTFQTMSYTIDIYRREMKPTNDVMAFFAFVAFFPQLVAGPIERAKKLLPQFEHIKTFDQGYAVSGLRLVLWGLFKKVVIADNFGLLANALFENQAGGNGTTVIFGCLFFALQIYADFSGYSDIAIGLARIIGFKLSVNFATPYFSSSFTEFWKRWHISLSTWFRDYVYIPLGGNREGGFRTYINILITFLLSGLWHGAEWTFLIWGGLHGLLLVAEKALKWKPKKSIFNRLLVFCVVMLLWLPFRAENYADFNIMATSLFDLKGYAVDGMAAVVENYSILRFTTLLIITLLFVWVETRLKTRDFSQWVGQFPKWTRVATYYVLLILIWALINLDVKPDFIYFQF